VVEGVLRVVNTEVERGKKSQLKNSHKTVTTCAQQLCNILCKIEDDQGRPVQISSCVTLFRSILGEAVVGCDRHLQAHHSVISNPVLVSIDNGVRESTIQAVDSFGI
jgi:hypothetical protein